jgi:PPE-repeat protein
MAGDQGASLAAAAAAYEALAAALMAEAAQMGATAGTTAATGFIGAGGTAMMATAIPYVAALEALAGWVQQSAAAAAGIEQAYMTAKAAMIPVPACTTNRTTQAGLVATNIIGQNTPAIIGLDTEYFGHFWTNNAAHMGGYEAIVTPILVSLGIPPPPAPLTANPAGPAGQAAAVAEAAAHGGVSAAMSQSLNGVNEAAGAVQPTAQTAAAAPASATQSLASFGPQALGQLGQLPQILMQPLGQFPQMLGQFPQMAMGMLGPLSSGMNPGGLAGLEKAAGDQAALAATTSTDAVRGGGGGGGYGGGIAGAHGVMSSYTRPTGSFNAPGPPKLPAGWAPAAEVPEAATSARPSSTGGTGGLYGAPPPHMLRDDRSKEGPAEGRTMQLTVGPRTGREV